MSRRLRVAFVTVGDTARITGGYLYDARVISGLEKLGHSVQEIVASRDSFDEQSEAAKSFHLDADAFDVVVVDALARVVCSPHVEEWRRSTALVILVHELPGTADPENAIRERPYEDALIGSGEIITVSPDGARRLSERGVNKERINVVPPGFDGIERLDKPDESPEVTDLFTALCVAQWIPRKNILELVLAWRDADVNHGKLLLVGDTDADVQYTRTVREAIAGDESIEVAGIVSDGELSRLYAASEIFVLPSQFEGYGVVYAEALANGLPVISRDIGPLSELLGDAASFIHPEAGVRELSRAIESLSEDANLRKRLSEAAFVRSERLPRWQDTVSGFEKVLAEVFAGRVAGQNRRSWNAVVGAHESHRRGMSGFLSGGGCTLFAEDLALLGDVAGQRIVHLQCNTGADTLSLASLGADVTGVDISDEAVSRARSLSLDSGIQADFERADVYEWLSENASGNFDVVYASYGVVCWLRDLDVWARGIRGVLREGGRFVLVEFHPFATVFDHDWKVAVPYRTGGEIVVDQSGVGDYVAASRGGLTPSGFAVGVRDFRNPEPCNLYNWGLGEVVSALCDAGMKIERLEEYPYSNGERHFGGMREGEGRRMFPPDGKPRLPLMYGIRAVADEPKSGTNIGRHL